MSSMATEPVPLFDKLPEQRLDDMKLDLPPDQIELLKRLAKEPPPDGPCEFDGRFAVRGKFYKGNKQ